MAPCRGALWKLLEGYEVVVEFGLDGFETVAQALADYVPDVWQTSLMVMVPAIGGSDGAQPLRMTAAAMGMSCLYTFASLRLLRYLPAAFAHFGDPKNPSKDSQVFQVVTV